MTCIDGWTVFPRRSVAPRGNGFNAIAQTDGHSLLKRIINRPAGVPHERPPLNDSDFCDGLAPDYGTMVSFFTTRFAERAVVEAALPPGAYFSSAMVQRVPSYGLPNVYRARVCTAKNRRASAP